MNWLFALILKPFVAVLFFFVAMLIAHLLRRFIPEGRVKRVLYSPLPWMRDKRHR